MHLWAAKTFYDSTFVVDDDIFHRLLEVGFLTAMASTIVHIRTVDMLSHPADYVDMFALSLSLLLANFISLLRQVEIGFTGVGEPGLMKQVSFRNSRDVMIPLSLQLAATIVAGMEYYGSDGSSYGDDSHRMLAAGTAGGSTNHIPIILTLAGPVVYQTIWMIRGICLFPNDGSHTKISEYLQWHELSFPVSVTDLFL